MRDGDKNICRNLANATSRENARFRFRPVIRAAPKTQLRTTAVRGPARRDERRFAFPVRGISFRVLGSFPKQTETERLNEHRIATATPNHRKRERNANSTGTSTSCASYRGVLLAASRSGPFDRSYIMNGPACAYQLRADYRITNASRPRETKLTIHNDPLMILPARSNESLRKRLRRWKSFRLTLSASDEISISEKQKKFC